jgi:hypothetical protein
MARYPGGSSVGDETGVPTTSLGTGVGASPPPGLSSITEGNQSFSEQPSEVAMGDSGPGEIPMGGTAGSGIETASSPAAAPGAPGGDIVEGLDLANNLGTPDTGSSGQINPTPNSPGSSNDQGRG